MKKIFATFLLFFFSIVSVDAAIIGGIKKNEELKNFNQIIDSSTGKGISKAKVSVPALKFVTITDDNGRFELNANITAPTILSVQKEGYKPFSLTLSETGRMPLIIGIEKNEIGNISIETEMIHLGDNNYSVNSANAHDFVSKSIGAFYTKDFKIPNTAGKNVFLNIGSIIGIDTLDARNIGQSKVRNSYASAPEIYCNGNRICELRLNGDNQSVEIPKGIIKENAINSITIKAGKNLFQTAYIDYDDIEFTNISIDIK
jgi:hypothetical protein